MGKKKKPLKQVSRPALLARVKRKLARADESHPHCDGYTLLCTARGDRSKQEVGEYYLIDSRHNAIAETHIDLEDYARELGVLQPWEALVEED